MAIVTVTGANGQISTLNYDTSLNTFLAQQVANVINGGVANGKIVPVNSPGTATLPPGTTGEYVVQTDGATVFVPVGFDDVVVTGSNTVVNLNTDTNQGVLFGAVNATVNATGGAGTIVGGSGNDRVTQSGDGNWVIALENGSDTVSVTGNGFHRVVLGTGASSVSTGTGTNLVQTVGNATISVGAGATSVTSSGNGNDLVFGGSGTLYFVGGNGSNTVIGGSGRETIIGGRGNNVFSTGSGGGTIYGGLGNASLQAGSGASLLTAQGSGSDTLAGGTGSSTLVGANGADIFAFAKGNAGTDVVRNFTSGQDKVALLGNTIISQTVVAGSDQVLLSDGTNITFSGFNNTLKTSDLA